MRPDPKTDPLAADFRNFLYVVWLHLGLPEPTPIQYDIAYWMQHGPRRKVIMAFRGVGKSWIYSAFVCWRLYCDPEWKIMIVSASKTTADQISTFVKRLIREMPELQHLQPRKDQRDSNIMFDVGPARASKDPSVKSVGITGQLAGSRANEILADDIEIPNNSSTATQRDKLGELVKEFDAVLKPDGIISYLGTPQTEDSLYIKLEERGYKLCIWPGRIPEEVETYKGRLAPFILDLIAKGGKAWEPTDPKRFGDTDLREREASYGRSGFALQYMLDTSLSDANRYPLKLADLAIMDVDKEMAPIKIVWASAPDQLHAGLADYALGLTGDRFYRPMRISEEYAAYTSALMYIDPSGRGSDETSYAVLKYLNGQLFCTAAGGFQGGYERETLAKLASIAKAERVNLVKVESNFGDGMFTQLLQPVFQQIGYPVSVEEVRSKGQKEARIIDTLEPIMNGHKLIVDTRVIEQDYRTAQAYGGERWKDYSLVYQLTHITKDRGCLAHDDRVEALAGACAHFAEIMNMDEERGVKEHKERLLDEELARFIEGVTGKAPRGPSWLHLR